MLLYINPKNKKSANPCEDELSQKMKKFLLDAIMQHARHRENPFSIDTTEKVVWGVAGNGHFSPSIETMGTHECVCGERSHSYDVLLPNGFITNTLAEHYLLWHRDEIPPEQIEKISAL